MKKGPNEPSSDEGIDELLTRFRSSAIYEGMESADKIELELAVTEGDREAIEGLTRILDKVDTNLQMVGEFKEHLVEVLAGSASEEFTRTFIKARTRNQKLEDVALSEAAAREAEQLQIDMLLDDKKNKN